MIEFTAVRSVHSNTLPDPIPKARQAFISSSIGKYSNGIFVDVVDDGLGVADNADFDVVDDEDRGVVDDDDLGVADDADFNVVGDEDRGVVDDDGLGVADLDAVDDADRDVADDDDKDEIRALPGENGAVVDRDDDFVVRMDFGMNSILLYFLIPSHLIFVFSFDTGKEQERIVR